MDIVQVVEETKPTTDKAVKFIPDDSVCFEDFLLVCIDQTAHACQEIIPFLK